MCRNCHCVVCVLVSVATKKKSMQTESETQKKRGQPIPQEDAQEVTKKPRTQDNDARDIEKDVAFFTSSGLLAFMKTRGLEYRIKYDEVTRVVVIFANDDPGPGLKLHCYHQHGFLLLELGLGLTNGLHPNRPTTELTNKLNAMLLVGKFSFRSFKLINSVALPVFDNPLTVNQFDEVLKCLLKACTDYYPLIQLAAMQESAPDHTETFENCGTPPTIKSKDVN